jgi:hypothetical protein
MKPEHEKRLKEIQVILDKYPVSREDTMWLIERFREADASIPLCRISELHPGDTIVFTFPGRITPEAYKHMCKNLAATLDVDVERVVILDEGADLRGIVRPESKGGNEYPRCHCSDPVNVRTNDVDTCGHCRLPIR